MDKWISVRDKALNILAKILAYIGAIIMALLCLAIVSAPIMGIYISEGWSSAAIVIGFLCLAVGCFWGAVKQGWFD